MQGADRHGPFDAPPPASDQGSPTTAIVDGRTRPLAKRSKRSTWFLQLRFDWRADRDDDLVLRGIAAL